MRSRAARAIVAAVGVVAVAAGVAAQSAQSIVVRDAWVREATPQDQSTGAFLVIENTSSSPVSLTGVEAEAAGAAEMHTMKMMEGHGAMPGMPAGGGMMTMEQVREVPVPAGGLLVLKPGGFHIMLFKIARPLERGSTTRLTLRFSNGATVPVTAAVVARTAMGR